MKLAEQRTDELLAAIGARRSTPGGGAVAAMTQALGVALAEMVVRFTTPASSTPTTSDDDHPDMQAMIDDLDRRRRAALEMADRDAEAFATLSRLWKLPPDAPERRDHWAAAVRQAIEAPREVLGAAVELLQLLVTLPGRTNRNLDSDLAIAAVLAEAAARSAAWNVRINLPQVDDPALVRTLLTEMVGQIERAADLRATIEAAIRCTREE